MTLKNSSPLSLEAEDEYDPGITGHIQRVYEDAVWNAPQNLNHLKHEWALKDEELRKMGQTRIPFVNFRNGLIPI